jgi:tRNA wybutosine-synthesizing protein 4
MQPITGPPKSSTSKIKSSKSKALDVQATNDSSSISKRSAERQGYFSEPQFLKPFIRKTQHRAPLIHAGYAIRTLAVHSAIDSFLRENEGQEVTVVSLGCGFEPSYFRLIARASLPCSKLRYVDVDYPALLHQKMDMMQQSEELTSMVRATQPGQFVATNGLDAEYTLLPCDMCDVKAFAEKLGGVLKDSPTLFISEVSLIYMPPDASTAVLKLAASYPSSSILILEQHLPDYTHTPPYASTMLHHFSHKVKTPLRGLDCYPTLTSKFDLLQECGWSDIGIQTLDQFWKDAREDPALTEAAWIAVKTEPFDEWCVQSG